jgi:ribosomal protein S18 acetylase RimI-like enzyme
MIEVKPLKTEHVIQMHACFNQAFADYAVRFELSIGEFKKKFIEKLQINFDLSCGAFDNGQLVGFIFTGIGYYKNKFSAYNGGTGVIPQYRGQGLTIKMYNYLFCKFKEKNIEQVVLEVISTNQKAISAYENSGLRKSELLRCYRLVGTRIKANKIDYSLPLEIKVANQPDWKAYKDFWEIQPGFLDQNERLEKNLHNEKIIEVKILGTIAGYAIFLPNQGRLSQFAINKEFRRRGIGTRLLQEVVEQSETKSITILNISEEAHEINMYLVNRGFENQINQYELIKQL